MWMKLSEKESKSPQMMRLPTKPDLALALIAARSKHQKQTSVLQES